MKNKFRFIAIILVAIFCCCSLGACKKGNGTDDEQIDHTKTQLFVAIANDGYGSRWLRTLKQRFQDKYANVSFQDGKMGVQVILDEDKSSFAGKQILSTMATSIYEVYFPSIANYYSFVDSDLLLDISDVVTGKLTDFGETKSIEDKLDDSQKEFLKVDNKYYAIPHYRTLEGIVYDKDLFNNKKYYTDVNGMWVGSNASNLSFGADGISGTYDDGLPATYDDFFALCDRMVQTKVTPMSWTGQYQDQYIPYILDALYTDYEGPIMSCASKAIEQGNINVVSSINNGVVTTEEKAITINNVSDMEKQAGRYYALNFLYKLLKNSNYYSPASLRGTQSHVMAQEDYIYSSFEGEKPIAMLIEGAWWEEEADSGFSDMVEMYGEEASRSSRNFGYLPIPKATRELVGTKTTLRDSDTSICFINKKIAEDKVRLAKLFLQFANTDESLAEFNTITGAEKALDYSLSQEQYDGLSSFAKSTYDIFSSSDVSRSDINNYANYSLLKDYKFTCVNAKIKGTTTISPLTSYLDNNVTSEVYFNSLIAK